MEVKTDNCDNCYNRHITSVAVNWCGFCSEGLCSVCTEHHQAFKFLKSHSLSPISDYHKLPHYIRDIKNCCGNHEEPFQLYCKTHEQCCCVLCVKETHSECKDIEALVEVTKDVKASPALEDIEICLKKIIGVFDDIRENRTKNQSRLTEPKEQIINQVRGIRKSINDHLDNLLKSIETQILSEFEAADLKVNEVLTEVENRQKNIRKLVEEEETIKQLSTNLQTFLGIPYFQDRIKEETEYIEHLKNGHKANELNLTFEPSELESFCENNGSIGTVTVSQNICLVDFDVGKKETAQIILSKGGIFDKYVSNLQQIQYKDPENDIIGCTILPSGQLLFIDRKSNNIVMRSGSSTHGGDFREIITIDGMGNVTLIDSTKAAVTVKNDKKIVIVDLLLGKKILAISLDERCWGIEFLDGYFIVKSLDGFLKVDAESRDIVDRIESNCVTCVTASYGKIFGCRHKLGIVYCFSAEGEKLWEFQNEKLKYPRDLTTDDQGFIYVTGKTSNNVIVIAPDGQKCKEILTQSDGLNVPVAIHFEKTLGLLLVCNEEKGAVICNIK